MSIHVLVTGTLHRDAVSRISQNGNNYVTCSVRTEQDGQTLWANVICFDEAAQEELLRLRGGDALSVQGKAAAKVYMKDDEARPSLQVTASFVLPLRPRFEPKSRSAPPPAKPRGKAAAKSTGIANHREEDGRQADDGFDDPLDF